MQIAVLIVVVKQQCAAVPAPAVSEGRLACTHIRLRMQEDHQCTEAQHTDTLAERTCRRASRAGCRARRGCPRAVCGGAGPCDAGAQIGSSRRQGAGKHAMRAGCHKCVATEVSRSAPVVFALLFRLLAQQGAEAGLLPEDEPRLGAQLMLPGAPRACVQQAVLHSSKVWQARATRQCTPASGVLCRSLRDRCEGQQQERQRGGEERAASHGRPPSHSPRLGCRQRGAPSLPAAELLASNKSFVGRGCRVGFGAAF